MNLKRFLYKIFYRIIIPLLCAAISGIIVWLINPRWEKTARENGWVSQAEWTTTAREKGWIPREECPANPTKLNINSPGDKAVVYYSTISSSTVYLEVQLVIASSKSISSSHAIGIIIKPEKDTNFYVDFPLFDITSDNIFSHNAPIGLDFRLTEEESVMLWAFLIENKSAIGNIYSDIHQISNNTNLLAISEPITISCKLKR